MDRLAHKLSGQDCSDDAIVYRMAIATMQAKYERTIAQLHTDLTKVHYELAKCNTELAEARRQLLHARTAADDQRAVYNVLAAPP